MNKNTILNRSEALRYLGYDSHPPDETTLKLLDQCEAELLAVAQPKYRFRVLDRQQCEHILIGQDISAHLDGCRQVVLLAATLGHGVDRAIRTAQAQQMAKAVVLDAVASAAIEEVCHQAEREIRASVPDRFLTWRFSPGYGDYPLSVQREFLAMLQADKTVGLTVNQAYLLVPGKSVTAVIGLSDHSLEPRRRGCQSCTLQGNCRFRQKGEHC